ncbi:hypothetical protein R4B61_05735 [Fructilactobacillus vespulae]|uniref:hypothetical protein n=1 Tax=Fructilactobacillus vespulae TaxID=1249630 RepID=UPI0039B3B47C
MFILSIFMFMIIAFILGLPLLWFLIATISAFTMKINSGVKFTDFYQKLFREAESKKQHRLGKVLLSILWIVGLMMFALLMIIIVIAISYMVGVFSMGGSGIL